MYLLADILITSLQQNGYTIEISDTFDNVYNINKYIDFRRNLDYYSILFWEKQVPYPISIEENKVPSFLVNIFDLLKGIFLEHDYKLVKYGMTPDDSLYIYVLKKAKEFELVLFMPDE